MRADPVSKQVNVLMFLIAGAFNIVVAFTVSAAFLMWPEPYAFEGELNGAAVWSQASLWDSEPVNLQ